MSRALALLLLLLLAAGPAHARVAMAEPAPPPPACQLHGQVIHLPVPLETATGVAFGQVSGAASFLLEVFATQSAVHLELGSLHLEVFAPTSDLRFYLAAPQVVDPLVTAELDAILIVDPSDPTALRLGPDVLKGYKPSSPLAPPRIDCASASLAYVTGAWTPPDSARAYKIKGARLSLSTSAGARASGSIPRGDGKAWVTGDSGGWLEVHVERHGAHYHGWAPASALAPARDSGSIGLGGLVGSEARPWKTCPARTTVLVAVGKGAPEVVGWLEPGAKLLPGKVEGANTVVALPGTSLELDKRARLLAATSDLASCR